jgi:hypothetical protein
MDWTLVLASVVAVGVPLSVALIGFVIHVEARLSRLEGKMDAILAVLGQGPKTVKYHAGRRGAEEP